MGFRNNFRLIAAVALAAGFAAGTANAESWHGFDPENFDGAPLPAAELKAMVAEAMAHTKPKNGSEFVVAFANLQRDIAFGVKVEGAIKTNADTAGIKLVIADNRLDGPTALANAQSFVRRHVDYVIEFQTDAAFGTTVMKQFDDVGTKVVAIDIPMPGATFFGANNPKAGYMGGSYLGEAAVAQFGADKVKTGYLVIGELPQSGAIPAMRTGGQIAGFQAVVPDLPADHIIKIDTKNTLQYSFQQMSNVLGRIPTGVPIMITAINDASTIGMLRAVQKAGREQDALAVGHNADEVETLVKEPKLIAAVGYFPERYGNYLIPIALESLAGKTLPPAVLVTHVMVTKANVCKYYDTFPCGAAPSFTYTFPQAKFEAYLTSLHSLKELADYQALIPTH